MKIIKTKFLGATDRRSGRIKAFDDNNNSLTLNYIHDLTGEGNHLKAAIALAKQIDNKNIDLTDYKNGYRFLLKGFGAFKDNYVFVFERGKQ